MQGHVEDVRRQVNEAIEARQVILSLCILDASCFKNMEGQVFDLIDLVWLFLRAEN